MGPGGDFQIHLTSGRGHRVKSTNIHNKHTNSFPAPIWNFGNFVISKNKTLFSIFIFMRQLIDLYSQFSGKFIAGFGTPFVLLSAKIILVQIVKQTRNLKDRKVDAYENACRGTSSGKHSARRIDLPVGRQSAESSVGA
jgi:hypothetical protein